jgi:hypothetical protein
VSAAVLQQHLHSPMALESQLALLPDSMCKVYGNQSTCCCQLC